ncbi:MAG TPA: MFS transporter [Chlamydiales bacterium]|nr:MFS transporter [Chlamydiales bacterium]
MKHKSSLYSLLFTIFNDAIGWGIVLTIFAPLLFDRSNAILPEDMTDATRNIILGVLISSYAVTQFVSMPLIGALSDHFGRKRVLEWTIFGAMVSFVFSALAVWSGSLFILFAARLLAGLFSGNASTAQAAIADMSSEKTKTKNLSLSGIVGGISWIVGPPMGAFLSSPKWGSIFNFSTPFWFLALLFLINLLWVNRSYVETHQKKERHDWKQEIKDLGKLSKIPRVGGWMVVSFLFYCGWFFFVMYYPTLFVQKFQFTQEGIGFFSAYLSLFWFSGSLAINKWFGGMNPERSIYICLPLLGLLMLIATLEGTITGWIWTFPFLALGATTVWINLMSLISNLSGRENQGKAFGVLQSMMSLATLIAPLITGFVATYNVEIPIYFGTCVLLLVGLYAFRLHSIYQKTPKF